jgi:hypothetical protein
MLGLFYFEEQKAFLFLKASLFLFGNENICCVNSNRKPKCKKLYLQAGYKKGVGVSFFWEYREELATETHNICEICANLCTSIRLVNKFFPIDVPV